MRVESEGEGQARNLLLERVRYQERDTRLGHWRRYLYPSGLRFAEFRSHVTWGRWPLIHYTFGISPETGGRVTARGIVAVGRRAFGVIALGQLAVGLLAIGQAAIGVLALGQASVGLAALGQVALAWYLGIGQLAAGHVVVAQLGLGEWVLAQAGFGDHVWSPGRKDPEALAYFRELWAVLRGSA